MSDKPKDTAAAQIGEPTVSRYFIECDQCGGSGFDTPGTGYGNVCGKCGGLRFLPAAAQVGEPNAAYAITQWLRGNANAEKNHDKRAAFIEAHNAALTIAKTAQVGEPQHSVDFMEGIAEGIERCAQVVDRLSLEDESEDGSGFTLREVAAAIRQLKDAP